jgi:hypothetical protein
MPNFSRAGAASWLSCGDACAVERAAADPLHGARINAKPGGNLPHALGSSRFVLCLRRLVGHGPYIGGHIARYLAWADLAVCRQFVRVPQANYRPRRRGSLLSSFLA